MKNIFTTNKDKVTILQVSDPQDLKYVRRQMTEMLDKAYDSLKPDLVLLTGDNILGNHLLDARFGSRQVAKGKEATFSVMKEALSYILQPIQKRQLPFAMIYGNHDDMNPVTKDEQMSIYRSYPCCMEGNTTDSTIDCDTYVIKVYKEDKLIYALFMMDSAWQDKDEKRQCHQEIKPESVKWFVNTNEELKKENGGEYVPALLITHIPLPATANLLMEAEADDEGATPIKDGGFVKLNPDLAKGYLGEDISIMETDNGLFDELIKAGNVRAVITGHDHTNCFEGEYKGIKFIQSGCASFRCYGTKETRGVRTIDIYPDGSFTTKYYTYYDLMGSTTINKIKYFMDSDENEKNKFALLGSLAGAITLTAGACIIKKIIKSKIK